MSDAHLELPDRLDGAGHLRLRQVARKLATARAVLHAQGARGILIALKDKLAPVFEFFDPQKMKTGFEIWRQREHWWVGLIVELCGDVVAVDSCTFRVKHPAVTTSMKSLFLQGSYEKAERDILKAHLDTSLGVIELGGSIGVVACLTNRMLKRPHKHVVVEANPDLIGLLQDNCARNGCVFRVLNRALAYGGDATTFYQNAGNFLASSVQWKTTRAITVPTISVGRIIDEYGFDRCTLICDIEGGEMDLVRYEGHILKEHVETMIVEIHPWCVGDDLAAEMIRTLETIGFRCVYQQGATQVFRNLGLAARADVQPAVGWSVN